MTRVVNIAQSGGNNVTMRNRIINGAMVIDQRNAGASVTSNNSGAYAVDRFITEAYGGGSLSSQQSSTAPTGFKNSLLITVTGTDTSLGTTDDYEFSQKIEGFNCADFGFGTAAAASVTLSFWVRSSVTGTYSVGFQNSDASRSYVGTYAINSANTWEQKTITVPGDTAGTWNTSNSTGLFIRWCLATGTNRVAAAVNTWESANRIAISATANPIMGTNGATFYITGVQLEAGTTATPFEQRLYGTELSLCQRYYYKWLNDTGAGKYVANIQAYSSAGVYGKLFDFPVPMRSTPTCSRSGTVTVFNAVSSPAGNPSVVSLTENTRFSMGSGDMNTGLSGLVAGNCSVISMANNGFFDASAEL